MTDEAQQGAPANQPPASGAVAEGGDPNAAPPTLEQVEAKRNADNLQRAKANGYVDPGEPSIGERVNALVDSVQHAMDHNAPMTIELFEEMKALLGHTNAAPAA